MTCGILGRLRGLVSGNLWPVDRRLVRRSKDQFISDLLDAYESAIAAPA
jgi:hypothetical protein